MVEQKKFEQTFINEYMAWNLHDTDVEQRGRANFHTIIFQAWHA